MQRPDANNPNSVRYRMRRARFQWVEKLLDQILSENETATILDIGGRRDYWKLLDTAYKDRIHVTILNTEEDVGKESAEDIGIKIDTVVGDGTNMPEYADGSFHLTHSNSVIEHVGLYRDMAGLARETARVGRAYYLQTPNFWFPLEPHYGVPFFHWLPEPSRIWCHANLNVGFAKRCDFDEALTRVDHTRIVSRRLLRQLLPDGIQESERFLGLTKSLITYRNYA